MGRQFSPFMEGPKNNQLTSDYNQNFNQWYIGYDTMETTTYRGHRYSFQHDERNKHNQTLGVKQVDARYRTRSEISSIEYSLQLWENQQSMNRDILLDCFPSSPVAIPAPNCEVDELIHSYTSPKSCKNRLLKRQRSVKRSLEESNCFYDLKNKSIGSNPVSYDENGMIFQLEL